MKKKKQGRKIKEYKKKDQEKKELEGKRKKKIG